MKNYFVEFYNRYEKLKTKLGINEIYLLEKDKIKFLLEKNSQGLNNLVMAGLGMGTLYLRMGAVLMIAEKTKPEAEEDVSFLKVIADKLIHKLPTDGLWKDIWQAYLDKNPSSQWNEILKSIPSIPNLQENIYTAFVAFRNKIVHQIIIIKSGLSDQKIEEIRIGLKILDAISKFKKQFEASIITTENNDVYYSYHSDTEKLRISPYVQINKGEENEAVGILPYLFQGRYYKGVKFINTEGAETQEEKDNSLDETFEKIKSNIARFNGDKAFDFNEKIENYNEWFIGRNAEVEAIGHWIKNLEIKNKVLPIFAPAGLGKGALVAKVIKDLKDQNINTLFHFCGSGLYNNLQAILYHLILQGKNYEYKDEMNNKQKKNIWNNLSSLKLQERLNKLPSNYVDVIELFQALLSATELEYHNVETHTKKESSKLVIIIDGLDEAWVADQSKSISDWFYTFDEKGERKEKKWKSPDHIKWIFTFRQRSKENKEGFQFEYNEFKTYVMPEVQPLKGLTKEAVIKAFKEEFKNFQPTLTEEYLQKIINKGTVK